MTPHTPARTGLLLFIAVYPHISTIITLKWEVDKWCRLKYIQFNSIIIIPYTQYDGSGCESKHASYRVL